LIAVHVPQVGRQAWFVWPPVHDELAHVLIPVAVIGNPVVLVLNPGCHLAGLEELIVRMRSAPLEVCEEFRSVAAYER
jgi:hypothetical protein